jgi:alkanesulfonate monooxygenase SsuD/methylene tetrahydromethanopterin reductase-like flavin-dependent oxidoreductase (luciferase family)
MGRLVTDDQVPRERRLAIGLLARPSLRDMARVARDVERGGFSAAFVAETQIIRDAVTSLTAMLLATTRLKVGTAAVNVFTRGAGLLAVTWATLAEAAPGRTILGLGVGSASTLAQQGFDVTHPIGRLREYTEAVRLLWSGEQVSYQGSIVTLRDAQLDVPPDPPPQVFYCVSGPQALRTAARLADGVIFDVFLPPAEVARMVKQVHDGTESRFTGEIGAGLMVSVADNWRDAADRIRPTVATYIARFPELAREMGLDDELVTRIRLMADQESLAQAADLVGDEVVDAVAVCGPPARCRRRIQDYRDTGLTLPVLFPEPSSLERVITDLAPRPE